MDKALETMINNLPEKTGKSLEEWKGILKSKAFEKHGEALKYLKEDFGVSHGFANTIVTLFRQESEDTEVDLVAEQYAGKEGLLPIYEGLVHVLKGLGNDVVFTPKKGSVSVIRKRQFVLIKPATKTRIDLGLKLKNTAPAGRLGDSGPFGTMCTHRVQLTDIQEIDDELMTWIRLAYEESV